MRGKENPEVTGLGGEVTPGPEQGDEKDNLPSRIERYSRAKHRASVMQKFCYDNDLPEHRALAACGNYLLFHHYYTVGKVRLVDATFCGKHLICPLCAIRRGSKMVQEYLARFQVLRNENPALKASMVTLTVKNGDDLEERFKHLKAGMQTLKGRRKNFKSKGWGRSEWRKVLGEVGAIEVKKGKNSNLWHPHAHILILHEEEIDWNALSSEWHEITGDSHQVDIAPLQNQKDPSKDFVEIFKYALKFSSMTVEDNFYAYMVLMRKRLVFPAGLFWGIKVPKELTDEPLENLPYIELFYRYLPGSGYNLTRSFDTENSVS